MADEAAPSDGKWLPIESNPAVMDEYTHRLGLPASFTFHDVVATEEWALEMVRATTGRNAVQRVRAAGAPPRRAAPTLSRPRRTPRRSRNPSSRC